MATVTITLTDEPGTVDVKIDFGDGGGQDSSPAHQMAVAMVRSQLGAGPQDEEEE